MQIRRALTFQTKHRQAKNDISAYAGLTICVGGPHSNSEMNSFTKIWLEHYRHINFLFICILTSLLQLAVTAITHFGHAVFHVLQRISVSAAAPANNLQQHKRAAPTVGSIPRDKALHFLRSGILTLPQP